MGCVPQTFAFRRQIKLAKKETGKIGLMRPEDVTDACVVCQPKAYPLYDDAYSTNIELMRRDLAAHHPTLHLTGHNGRHAYTNKDHAMMTGFLLRSISKAGDRLRRLAGERGRRISRSGASGIDDALTSERLVPRKVTETGT